MALRFESFRDIRAFDFSRTGRNGTAFIPLFCAVRNGWDLGFYDTDRVKIDRYGTD